MRLPSFACGMDDVILQVVYRLHRIVPRHHDEVCRVHIDCNAGGMQTIQELFQNCRLFRSCFNCKMCIQGIRILCQLKTCLLHDLIAFIRRIRRNNIDMSCHNVGFQLLCKV